MMVTYKNSSGQSGIKAYEIVPEGIAVQFMDGDIYLYTYASTGKEVVEKMKKLAVSGKKLATYISQNVQDKFEKRLR